MEKSVRASLNAVGDDMRALHARFYRGEVTDAEFERAASELEARRRELTECLRGERA